MAYRGNRKDARRRPPSEVEQTALRRNQLSPKEPIAQVESFEVHLELELEPESADRLEAIQSGWDERTRYLRSRGVDEELAISTRDLTYLQLRHQETSSLVPFVQIWRVDRPAFGYSAIERADFEEKLPPDEYEREVESAIKFIRTFALPRRDVVDNGPRPSQDAVPIGPAYAWRESTYWAYSRYRVDSPLSALKSFEYSIDYHHVLRIATPMGSEFIRGARRYGRR